MINDLPDRAGKASLFMRQTVVVHQDEVEPERGDGGGKMSGFDFDDSEAVQEKEQSVAPARNLIQTSPIGSCFP
jgi:hypothetical protein